MIAKFSGLGYYQNNQSRLKLHYSISIISAVTIAAINLNN
jgi:hypothetical protein